MDIVVLEGLAAYYPGPEPLRQPFQRLLEGADLVIPELRVHRVDLARPSRDAVRGLRADVVAAVGIFCEYALYAAEGGEVGRLILAGAERPRSLQDPWALLGLAEKAASDPSLRRGLDGDPDLASDPEYAATIGRSEALWQQALTEPEARRIEVSAEQDRLVARWNKIRDERLKARLPRLRRIVKDRFPRPRPPRPGTAVETLRGDALVYRLVELADGGAPRPDLCRVCFHGRRGTGGLRVLRKTRLCGPPEASGCAGMAFEHDLSLLDCPRCGRAYARLWYSHGGYAMGDHDDLFLLRDEPALADWLASLDWDFRPRVEKEFPSATHDLC